MNSKRYPMCVAGVLLFVLTSSARVHGAEQTVELSLQTVRAIKGVVVFPNGDLVKGARVAELTSDWKTEVRATATDSEGRFYLPPVRGRKIYYLQVTVSEPGVNPLRVPVKISRFCGKKSLRLPLRLA